MSDDPFRSDDHDTFRDGVVNDPLRAADEIAWYQRALYRTALMVNEEVEGVELDHDLGIAFREDSDHE